jgi:hypothetical protein
MKNYNPIATPMELGTKLSRYDEGEEVDVNLYRSLIGSLKYITCTRPDIMFVVAWQVGTWRARGPLTGRR